MLTVMACIVRSATAVPNEWNDMLPAIAQPQSRQCHSYSYQQAACSDKTMQRYARISQSSRGKQVDFGPRLSRVPQQP
jgi:hypothetical protein